MKVKIQFTVDIDPEAWEREYSPSVSVRQDVNDYVRNSVLAHLDDNRLGVN